MARLHVIRRRRGRPHHVIRPFVPTFSATTAPAGVAAVTVAANAPSVIVAPVAGVAPVTVDARQPSILVQPVAGLASVTVTAEAPTPVVIVNAGVAAVTVTAHQPTISTANEVFAPAGLAEVTVVAEAPALDIVANAGVAAVTADAPQPGVHVRVNAEISPVTVTAEQPQGIPGKSAFPGVAGVTVAAPQPTKRVAPSPGVAAVTVTAENPGTDIGTALTLPIGLGGTIDYLPFLKVGSLVIQIQANRRDGTMDLTLIGTAQQLYGDAGDTFRAPVVENPIAFMQGSTALFDGIIRSVKPRELHGNLAGSGGLELAITAQDWTSAYRSTICDPIVGSLIRTTVESDKARIQWILDTVLGASLVTVEGVAVVSAMPTQDFTGMTLAQALDDVCKITGADWYVVMGTHGETIRYDSTGVIRALTTPFGVAATDTLTCANHGLSVDDRIIITSKSGGTGLALNTPYWVIASGLTASNFKVSLTQGGAAVDFTTNLTTGAWYLVNDLAPFDLSDAPDGVTSFGYQDLVIPEDSSELKQKVLVLGGGGYFETFNSPEGYPQYEGVDFGQRMGVIKDDEILDSAAGQQAALGFFAEHGAHRTDGTLTTFRAGINPGMDLRITSSRQLWNQHAIDGSVSLHAGSPQTFRVAGVTIQYPREGDLRWRVAFGSIPRLLHHAIFDIARPREVAQEVIAGVLRGYIGEIIGWPTASPPTGFVLCDGASLLRAGQYADLFAVIGTTFGAVDGTHFNLPDLRGRFPLGVDGSHAVGTTGGSIDHTHSQPTHSHTGPSHTHTGPSHTHTQPTHTHTGPSHTHTGPSHSHTQPTHTHTGPSHTHTGPSHTHTGPSHSHELPVSESTGINFHTSFGAGASRARVGKALIDTGFTSSLAVDLSNTSGTGATGSGGTGATGSGGTGATSADGDDSTATSGTGATGSSGTGLTGADGNDDTGASGTGASGSGGTGATGTSGGDTTGTNNPPYIAIHYAIRFA